KDSMLIQIAMEAATVENPYRLYYGESDMPTPDFICEALTDAVRGGYTTYTPTPGDPDLRAAICQKVHELHGGEYRPTKTVCTAGAGMAIFLAIRACVGAGDNAVIVSPAFSLFASSITVVGGEVREVPLRQAGNQFHLDLDQVRAAIDSRTRLLVVNSP